LTTETNPEAADGAVTDSAQAERAEPGHGADDRTQWQTEEQTERRAEEGSHDAGGAAGGDEGGDEADDEELYDDAPAGLTRGIWWAAVLLPFLSVAGAVLCFSAGVLNSGGCQPVGSALCSGSGFWSRRWSRR